MGYKTEHMSESAELVRTLMRNINDRKPLTTTLDKYVKVVRTEHCFLLFEELGTSDKWLQCLEVCVYICIYSFSLYCLFLGCGYFFYFLDYCFGIV